MKRLLRPTLSMLTALTSACGPTAAPSALNDDETPPQYMVLNEAGLKNFTAGSRDALGHRLETAKFPLYDRQNVEHIGDVETKGESWMVNPETTLVVEMKDMHFMNNDPSHWQFELVGKGPFAGKVKSQLIGTFLGVPFKTDLVDTTYSADLEIHLFGDLTYKTVPGVEEETGDPISVVKIEAVCQDVQGTLDHLQIASGLAANDVIEGIIKDRLNAIIMDNRARFVDQVNASIQDAANRGEMTSTHAEFWSVFQVGG